MRLDEPQSHGEKIKITKARKEFLGKVIEAAFNPNSAGMFLGGVQLPDVTKWPREEFAKAPNQRIKGFFGPFYWAYEISGENKGWVFSECFGEEPDMGQLRSKEDVLDLMGKQHDADISVDIPFAFGPIFIPRPK